MIYKVVFYISLIAAILLTMRVAHILINDLPRLTDYGYGYLTGKIILLLLFGLVAFFTGRKMKKSRSTQ